MKRNKNRKILGILSLTILMIVAIICGTVYLIFSQKKENRYYEQLGVAKMYLEQADYEKIVRAYEQAIELKPEEPEAYVELANYYLQEGKYYESLEIARLGVLRTKDTDLQDLIVFINNSRTEEFEKAKEKLHSEEKNTDEESSRKVVLRKNVVDMAGEYCFQQYVNEYKQMDIRYISQEAGYQVKFKGLEADLYFKNIQEYGQMIDEYEKKPMPKAKPYKVIIRNPEELFVRFEGYIENSRLEKMFDIEVSDALMEEEGKYYLSFEFLGCDIKISTDHRGNISEETKTIELSPLNLISDWEEPEQEEEETEPDTFVLAGETYTYDVTDIYIYNAVLDDLSPLAQCKNLRTIEFIGCQISDLSPLSGCSALEELNLEYSTGGLELSCLSGLTSLKYLGFHECKDIADLSPVMDLELELLHPCASSVSYEQCMEYLQLHPDCEVWFDYYPMN